MKKMILALLFVLLGSWALDGGRAQPAAGPEPAGKLKTLARAASPTPADWRRQWDETVAEAGKEGKVVAYAGSLGESARKLSAAFKDRFGISLEIVQGRGEEVVARINSERKAGIFGADVGLPGMTWYFGSIKPLGITLPLQPFLILPEVLDPSQWREHKLPLGDKTGHLAVLLLSAAPHVIVNDDFVKANEITSLSDLLLPRWRGRIVMNDPSVGGAGAEVFTFTVREVMGLEKGTAFMKALAGQEPVILRDLRSTAEWVARGKYHVGWGPDKAAHVRFIRSGAHLSYPNLKEPRATTSAAANLMLFDKAPHPNAAKLFANWILSREGATVFSQAYGMPSTRLDVPSEGIDPALRLKPDEKILGEEYQLAKGEMRKLARDIFRGLLK